MSFHQKCAVRSELDWTGLRWINGFSVSKITQDGQRSARELQRIQIIPYRRTDGGEEGASNFTRTWKLKSNSSDKCALRKKYPSSSKQWRQTSPYIYLFIKTMNTNIICWTENAHFPQAQSPVLQTWCTDRSSLDHQRQWWRDWCTGWSGKHSHSLLAAWRMSTAQLTRGPALRWNT